MIVFSCPGCHATFNLPDEVAGKSARCSKCSHRFSVPASNGKPAVVAAAPKLAAAAASAGPKKVALNPVSEVLEADIVEVVEEVPPKARAAKPLDDVEIVETIDQVQVVDDSAISERRRPAEPRRSARDDDDDDDDGIRRRGKRRRSKSGGSTGIIIGSIVGGVLVVAVIVVVIVLMMNRSNPQANRGMPPEIKFEQGGNQGNPGQGIPAANNAPGGILLDRQDSLTRNDPFDTIQRQMRCKRYTVQLEANKTYQIDMIASQRFGAFPFDPFLRIEQNGVHLDDDDDGGNELDASLVFRPQAAGAYVIVATSFEPQQTGSYRLIVKALP